MELALGVLALLLPFVLFFAHRVGARQDALDEAERQAKAVREHTAICGPCPERGVVTVIPPLDELPDGPVMCPTCGQFFGFRLDATGREILRQLARETNAWKERQLVFPFEQKE